MAREVALLTSDELTAEVRGRIKRSREELRGGRNRESVRLVESAARLAEGNYHDALAADLYTRAGARGFVKGDYARAAKNSAAACRLYSRLGRNDEACAVARQAKEAYLKLGQSARGDALKSLELQAQTQMAVGEFAAAGELYLEALGLAEGDREEVSLISQAASAFAMCGEFKQTEACVDRLVNLYHRHNLREAFSQLGTVDSSVERLMNTLDVLGQPHLGRRVYLEQMRSRDPVFLILQRLYEPVRRFAVAVLKPLSRVVGGLLGSGLKWLSKLGRALVTFLWGRVALYGESWGRWASLTVGALFVYTLVYLPAPFEAWAKLELHMMPDYVDPDRTFTLENMARAFSFSTTVFTTLGFGNVYPENLAAELVVASEVCLGALLFGVLVALALKRFSRKI